MGSTALSLNRRSPWELVRRFIFVFDRPLLIALGMVLIISIATMYSAGLDFPGRFNGHLRNIGVALAVLWVAALLPPSVLMRAALPLYVLGIALLVAVALFGSTSKGATRWLDLGFTRIQPSEMIKITTPLILAWYFDKREGALRWFDFLIAAALLIVPFGLIAKQPDLGTAILVLAILLMGGGWAWSTASLLLALATPVIAAGVYVLARIGVEMVRLVCDMLLPK
jgi:cell division protein FtsW (lipid II flippase)